MFQFVMSWYFDKFVLVLWRSDEETLMDWKKKIRKKKEESLNFIIVAWFLVLIYVGVDIKLEVLSAVCLQVEVFGIVLH